MVASNAIKPVRTMEGGMTAEIVGIDGTAEIDGMIVIDGTAGIVAMVGIVETVEIVETVAGMIAMAEVVTGVLVVIEVIAADVTTTNVETRDRGVMIMVVGTAVAMATVLPNRVGMVGHTVTDNRVGTGSQIGTMTDVTTTADVKTVVTAADMMVGTVEMVPGHEMGPVRETGLGHGTTVTARLTDKTVGQGMTHGAIVTDVVTTSVPRTGRSSTSCSQQWELKIRAKKRRETVSRRSQWAS